MHLQGKLPHMLDFLQQETRNEKQDAIVLKLINNSCIHKPIRIRQFGQVRVVWNPDETLDRGLSTIVWWNIKL